MPTCPETGNSTCACANGAQMQHAHTINQRHLETSPDGKANNSQWWRHNAPHLKCMIENLRIDYSDDDFKQAHKICDQAGKRFTSSA